MKTCKAFNFKDLKLSVQKDYDDLNLPNLDITFQTLNILLDFFSTDVLALNSPNRSLRVFLLLISTPVARRELKYIKI